MPVNAPALEADGLIDGQNLSRWAAGVEIGLKQIIAQPDKSMGFLEAEVLQQTLALQREILERATQARADRVPLDCPCCKRPLEKIRPDQKRQIDSRCGEIGLRRAYGWCVRCEEWFYPADWALGLEKNAPASPLLQETMALLVLKMPAAEASKVAERVLGRKLSRATLDREARRQGIKAQEKRDQMDQHPVLEEIKPASQSAGVEPKAFTLVIELDTWNIRERDHWGKTEKLRRKGEECGRWHWAYTGTCFRLDQRLDKNGRAIILSRGFVATREGLDAFRQQLWAEAMRHGLAQAQKVLVVADGALWIWNLVEDRFEEADQRLDLFHGKEHLWAVAAALHGADTPQASQWVEPLLRQLKKGQAQKVIQTLKELAERLKRKNELKKIVERERDYFKANQERMDYAAGQKLGEPIGSGAVEATCRQYQCRFKRTGQFWTQTGDEALLSLETFWRNARWSMLYPHSQGADPNQN